jgi:hypothetical protein
MTREKRAVWWQELHREKTIYNTLTIPKQRPLVLKVKVHQRQDWAIEKKEGTLMGTGMLENAREKKEEKHLGWVSNFVSGTGSHDNILIVSEQMRLGGNF